MTDLKHDYAKLSGATLHYVTAGAGDPVMLLHGWPQTWYMWRKIIPILAEKYLVIAPDMRGLGDSSRPTDGYDKRTVAADIRELAHRHLGHEKIFLVGHDWGGPVAFAHGVAEPDRVRKLVLLDVPIPGDGTDVFSHDRWHHAFHWITDVPEALTLGRERLYLEIFYKNWGARPDAIEEEAIVEYVRAYSQPGAMRAGFNYYRGSHQDVIDNQATLASSGKLKMPVLSVAGTGGRGRGASVVLNSARRVAEDVRGGEITNAGHWLAEEQPEEVSRQILEFLSEP
ncbi:MAG: alpha/beta hydrolase [Alphaproteobacteria bacterium]|jgi:pimeloyl-ACP methyl ester carboxylesterase|nr:alpha/beta hydrolase [Alphaproteobacteria bacterium]